MSKPAFLQSGLDNVLVMFVMLLKLWFFGPKYRTGATNDVPY